MLRHRICDLPGVCTIINDEIPGAPFFWIEHSVELILYGFRLISDERNSLMPGDQK